MANWSLPTESSLYTDVLDFIGYRLDDLALGFPSSRTYSNLPTGTIGFNNTSNKWQKWNGTAWADLASTYGISINGTSSNITGITAPINGGTGLSSYTIGDLLIANGSTSISKLSSVTAGRVLTSKGVASLPSWDLLDLETSTTGILPVSKGGTGINSITGLILGNGTSDFSSASAYISIDTSNSLVSIAGDIKINGNEIQSSSGSAAISLSGSNISVIGTLKVSGNSILSSTNTAITLSGSDVYIEGAIILKGNTINSSTATAITLSGSNATISGSLTVSANMTTTGNISAGGDITSTSDIRLKTNIVTVPNALELVNNLRGVYFDMKGKKHLGVIAQEIEKVLPEVVNNDNEYKSVAYGNIVGVLIEAIKELSAKVEKLENAG